MANRSLSQLLADWRQARQNMEKLKSDLPRIVGNESVKVVKDNFKLHGYDSGTGIKQWEQRTEKTNKSYDKRTGVKGTVYQSSNPLLMQTRNLYNAIKYAIQTNTVTIGVDEGLIPYAKRMNEGGGGIPARKFIPTDQPNGKILKRVTGKWNRERDKAMKIFKK